MKSKRLSALLVLIALLSIPLHAYGMQTQGAIPTDSEISQLKKNIQEMEKVTPPPNYEAQHRRDIAEMRLNLRDKLQAQRNAMATYARCSKISRKRNPF